LTPEEKLDVICMMYLAALGFKPDHARANPELMEQTRKFVISQMSKPGILRRAFIEEPEEPDAP